MHSQDPIRTDITLKLIQEFKIQSFVETGSYHGETAAYYAPYVKKVYTCELNKLRFLKTQELCRDTPNIEVSDMKSPDYLYTLNPEQPCLFYLDAHWEDDWPLPQELTFIYALAPRSIIIIDDCFVPNPNFVGCYGGKQGLDKALGRRLDFEYVKEIMQEWSTKFQYLAPNYATEQDHKIGYLILNGRAPLDSSFSKDLDIL